MYVNNRIDIQNCCDAEQRRWVLSPGGDKFDEKNTQGDYNSQKDSK